MYGSIEATMVCAKISLCLIFNFLFDFLMWFEARNAKIIYKFIGVRLALRSAHAISY
jgi:hypothetical protein